MTQAKGTKKRLRKTKNNIISSLKDISIEEVTIMDKIELRKRIHITNYKSC